jgi:hypothetical protein
VQEIKQYKYYEIKHNLRQSEKCCSDWYAKKITKGVQVCIERIGTNRGSRTNKVLISIINPSTTSTLRGWVWREDLLRALGFKRKNNFY